MYIQVWEEDLPWARELVQTKKELEEKKKEEGIQAVHEDRKVKTQSPSDAAHVDEEVDQPN